MIATTSNGNNVPGLGESGNTSNNNNNNMTTTIGTGGSSSERDTEAESDSEDESVRFPWERPKKSGVVGKTFKDVLKLLLWRCFIGNTVRGKKEREGARKLEGNCVT